ncbi:protein of unknown function (plasmid) [Pararobbsia alpina]
MCAGAPSGVPAQLWEAYVALLDKEPALSDRPTHWRRLKIESASCERSVLFESGPSEFPSFVATDVRFTARPL